MKITDNYNLLFIEQGRNAQDAAWLSQMTIEKSPARRKLSENARKSGTTKLYIKNMVSIRCIIIVKAVLKNMDIQYSFVELGNAEIVDNLTQQKRNRLKSDLLSFGLELLEDKKNILVEKIKNIIIEMIHYGDEMPKTKFSDYLCKKLNLNYTYLSNLFSEVKSITIEHFIMSHKIERVKELLVYDELTLSEIAWKLHYSSVAHLSNQFKKITGLTPSHFKMMKHKRLLALELV